MMAISLTGQRFGRLQTLWLAGRTGRNRPVWACQCDCGTVVVVMAHNLTARKFAVRSCGCLRRDHARSLMRLQHGHARRGCSSPEYRSFLSAKGRCTNPKDDNWDYYGGRGIRFRFESFEQFYAELGPRPIGTSLDRINVNGHYKPGNCRWATPAQQRLNQRGMAA